MFLRAAADEAFLISSTRELMPVVAVVGGPSAAAAPGAADALRACRPSVREGR
jgi:branched-subunit amino acid aminotransferase/4-amino-4-deoxychorismate lyase